MKLLGDDFFSKDLKPILALLVAVFAVYGRSLGFDFTPMDEHLLILNNEKFLSSKDAFYRAFTEPTLDIYYRPFHFASFILNYKFDNVDPFGYHLFNVLIHLLNCILLFKLLPSYSLSKKTSFFLTLAFAVHPALLSTVVWVPGRNDSMLCFFFFSGLLAQNAYLRSGAFKNLIYFALSFVGALLCKESAVFLPLIFLVNAYIKNKDIRSTALNFGLPLIIMGALWFFVRSSIVPEIPVSKVSFGTNLLNFIQVILVYLGKSIIPVEQSVFPTLQNSNIWWGLIVLVIIGALIFLKKLEDKSIAYLGLLIFFGTLIIPVWFMSHSVTREQYENRIYVSLFGMLLFASQVRLDLKLGDNKMIIPGFLLCLSALTFYRMGDYSSETAFLDSAIKDNPDNYFFRQKMADKLLFEEDLRGAIEHYSEAIRIKPNEPMFYNNRASIYANLKMKAEAIRDHDSAARKSNNSPYVLLNRAITLSKFDEHDAAINELGKLKQCCQDIVPLDVEQEIITRWRVSGLNKIEALLKTQPNNAMLYANRARLLYDLGEREKALADKQKALSLAPDNVQIREYLRSLNL